MGFSSALLSNPRGFGASADLASLRYRRGEHGVGKLLSPYRKETSGIWKATMPLFSRSRSRSSGSDNTAGDATATAYGGASGRQEMGSASQGNGEDDRLRKETATPSSMAMSADEAIGMCRMFCSTLEGECASS